MARGRSNGNERGNWIDRLRRKRWILQVWQSNKGRGTCRCYRCGDLLTQPTLTIDRIIPGSEGGTYCRNNIRPACMDCNRDRHNLREK